MAGAKPLPKWQLTLRRRWRIVATVAAADKIPHQLPPNCAVVVADDEGAKWLAFDCPCKSGHRIQLNLDRARFPHWTLAEDTQIDLTPSVDLRSGARRCHFVIREGKLSWINRTDEEGNAVTE